MTIHKYQLIGYGIISSTMTAAERHGYVREQATRLDLSELEFTIRDGDIGDESSHLYVSEATIRRLAKEGKLLPYCEM